MWDNQHNEFTYIYKTSSLKTNAKNNHLKFYLLYTQLTVKLFFYLGFLYIFVVQYSVLYIKKKTNTT